MMRLSRTVKLIILGLCVLVLTHIYSTISYSPPDYCPARRDFGNLTETHYFLFIKPKFADADVFSNMFFYHGLKHSRRFAMNIESPAAWHGLSRGLFDSSFLQDTFIPPRMSCQEMDYSPERMGVLFGENFIHSNKVVVGFLRDPYEVFMSCLTAHIQSRRKINDPSVSMSLDVNVNNYIDTYQIGGNMKSTMTYVGPHTCHNGLAYSLGLNDDLYRTQFNPHTNPQAAEEFAELVESRVSDFIIYEHLLQSMFLMKERYCLSEDMLYLTRIPENYVSIGLGKISQESKERLRDFLRYDYTIYERVVSKFQTTFSSRLSAQPLFEMEYLSFQERIVDFTKHCCRKSLSLNAEESRIRAYSMTEEGRSDPQCALINGNNVFLANMVFQLQEYQFTDRVALVLRSEGGTYRDVLEIVNETLADDGT